MFVTCDALSARALSLARRDSKRCGSSRQAAHLRRRRGRSATGLGRGRRAGFLLELRRPDAAGMGVARAGAMRRRLIDTPSRATRHHSQPRRGLPARGGAACTGFLAAARCGFSDSDWTSRAVSCWIISASHKRRIIARTSVLITVFGTRRGYDGDSRRRCLKEDSGIAEPTRLHAPAPLRI
jgi:hypothetical protein